MNLKGYSQWGGLVPITYFYDPLSGMQYQLLPVLQPTNLLSNLTIDYSSLHLPENSLERTSNQTTREQRNSREGEETPKNAQQKIARAIKPEKDAPCSSKNAPRKYKRKPERNSLTNIGNQVLVFAYMRRRCDSIIRRRFPDLTEDQLRGYYAFAKQVKNSMLNYITFDKLADAWLDPHPESELNHRILRTVCHYFVREQLAIAIMTSKKLPQNSKSIHLKSRRQLLAFFRNEEL